MDQALRDPAVKNREVIAETFAFLLHNSPKANASDLWHHVVYRLYCRLLNRYKPQNPNQSWVRASGEALELFVEHWYSGLLEPYGIDITALISRESKRRVLVEMGLGAEVGDSKLDVALYLRAKNSDRIVIGGVHVKASLAERVSDDVPASRAMMRKGHFSPLWTLDVKSFPDGDLVNRGELGTPESPSEKRKYIEEHGEFDNCYSANSRSVASKGQTRSGKRIYTINLSEQPDQFARDLISHARPWKKRGSS